MRERGRKRETKEKNESNAANQDRVDVSIDLHRTNGGNRANLGHMSTESNIKIEGLFVLIENM